MGLLYIMPVSESESDRVIIDEDQGRKQVHAKSYGLPMIFWGYLLAILAVVFIMSVAIIDPLTKVINGEDQINRALGIIVSIVLIGAPLSLLGFFFYEKTLSKTQDKLLITHKVFWIPIFKKRLELKAKDSFALEHYLDSPNMARMQDLKEMKAFENKGYFELFAITKDEKLIRIDRSSQRRELGKLKDFLSQY